MPLFETSRRRDWPELNAELCAIEERLAAIKRDFTALYGDGLTRTAK